jgi:2-methylisocitrate lyase-like PEP mutase family enzyme
LFNMPLSLGVHPGKNQHLRQMIESGEFLIVPGVFDCLTARLAEVGGVKALYMTGSGVSISRLGAPDIAILSFAEIVDQAKRIADVTHLPLIADADTGYGGPLNVIRTVREFERAGVSAIQIEDQDWPKRCGHELGRTVVAVQEMVGRIKAAVDTRVDQNFLVVARTDARTSNGLQDAIERSLAYVEAGADVIFVESPESIEEMRAINQSVQAPSLSNQVEGGRTPMRPASELAALGYRLAIYPNSMTRLIAGVGQDFYRDLQQSGSTAQYADRMVDHRALWDLFDYPAFIETEKRYLHQQPGED